jgi:tetratricopeptide (TPR) repeat protein
LRNHKILFTAALLGAFCFAQQTQTQTPSAPAQPGSQQPGSQPQQPGTTPPTQPGTQQQPGTEAAPATPAPAPKPDKQQPMARSNEEFAAYQAVANNADNKAALVAADDFATKFPDSELRVPLYINIMNKFYSANDADSTVEAADRILKIEPDHTMALVISSGVLAERTRETDLDRDERLAKAGERAERAIRTIDTGLVVPKSVTPEQLAGIKQWLTSMAKGNLAYIELTKKNYPAAEKLYVEAVELGKSKPDGTTYYRLALAQHGQKKFGDALKNATKAVELAQTENNPALLSLAQEEKAKLEKAK